MKHNKFLIFLVVMFCISVVFVKPQEVYGEVAVTKTDIANDNTNYPAGYYYFLSSKEYVYKSDTGCGAVKKVSDLGTELKVYYREEFRKAGSDTVRFNSGLNVFSNLSFTTSPNNPASFKGTIFWTETSTILSIKLNGANVQFYIPSSQYKKANGVDSQGKTVYKWEDKTSSDDQNLKKAGNVSKNSAKGIKSLMNYAKEGLIAANIEKGFNVGSVYSTAQKPLNDVMVPITSSDIVAGNNTGNNTGSTPNTSGGSTGTGTSLTNYKGALFKFKQGTTMQASLDFFYCPLFGKVSVENLPKDSKEWNKKVDDIVIDGDSVVIDSGYISFINGNSPENDGIQDSANLTFENGVKAYKDGSVTSEEPLQKVNYNMRIAVPFYFKQKPGNNYAMDITKLHIIPDLRMSVYNDTLYKTDPSTGEVTKVCTNADMDLSRDYIAFFNTVIDGKKVGVVIILKYNECVVDTNNTGALYLTGRKIAFGGNYSSSLNIDEANKDVMFMTSGSSGNQGVLARNFAFSVDQGGDASSFSSIYGEREAHKELDTSDFMMLPDFNTIYVNDVDANSSDEEKAGNVFQGFTIVRNNTYVSEDGSLLNWLASKEAKSTPFVFAEDLRKKIRGEFSASMLDYDDWKQMQEIKGQLDNNKNSFLPHILNVVSIIFGVFLIFFGVFLALAYWFDIFNAFSDFSILYWLSNKRMYPVTSDDTIQYGPTNDGTTKFVNFWQVLKVTFSCWLIGFVFLNSQELFYRFLWLYQYIMSKLGG